MPKAYSLDLGWRIIWACLMSPSTGVGEIAKQFNVCERTVKRYLKMFQQTGEIQPFQEHHGPKLLLGEFEQLTLLRLIFDKPGIYLKEIQDKLMLMYGFSIPLSTIYRTLKIMGCSRQAMHRVALQRSDELRARFMADVSVYDPSRLMAR